MPGKKYAILATGVILLLSACGRPVPTATVAAGLPLKVTVSITPQKYLVERIGGDRVSVSVMVEPGFNPATYEPKPRQISGLSETQLYIRIRVPFEDAWMERIRAANKDMVIVDQSKGVERIDDTDPHIWLSPRLVKIQARTIYSALAEMDPGNEAFYRANLDAFLADVNRLDAEIRDTLSGLPSRKLMVFHPAWAYFARDYDLEMISVQIGGSEPSAAEMAQVIRTARENNIRVIFAQPEFSTESAEAIAAEIGGEVLLISPLAADWLHNLRRVAHTFADVLAEQE